MKNYVTAEKNNKLTVIIWVSYSNVNWLIKYSVFYRTQQKFCSEYPYT